jgi:hypothetical protein
MLMIFKEFIAGNSYPNPNMLSFYKLSPSLSNHARITDRCLALLRIYSIVNKMLIFTKNI